MQKIETLKNKSGESIYPLTSTKAVVDENGNTIEHRLVVADGEDLVTDGNVLRLKDRPNTDGMGYVILRKEKTFQEQVTKPNTIYEIRYDFDLNGAEITIPAGCVLKFEGGSLRGGSLNVNEGCSIYCGVFLSMRRIILGNYSHLKNCKFYSQKKHISINGDNITIEYCTFENCFNEEEENTIVLSGSYVTGKNLHINNCIFKGLRATNATYSRFIRLNTGNTFFKIENCLFDDIDGNGHNDVDCIQVLTNTKTSGSNLFPYEDSLGDAFGSLYGEIKNCRFTGVKNAKSIIKIQASNISVTNNFISIEEGGNLDVGLDIVGAIRVINSDDICIEGNIISYFEKAKGLLIEYSSNVVIRNNNIERKSIEGDSVSWGDVRIHQTKDVVFENNYIKAYNSWMILAWSNSVNLKIINNTIIGKISSGIYIIGLLKKYCTYTEGVIQSTIFTNNNILDEGDFYSRMLFTSEKELIFSNNTFRNQKDNYTVEFDKDVYATNDSVTGYKGNIIAKGKSIEDSKLFVSSSNIERFEVSNYEVVNNDTAYKRPNSVLLTDSKFSLIDCDCSAQVVKGLNENNTLIVTSNKTPYNVVSNTSQEITEIITNATNNRPLNPIKGYVFFDTILNKPIWWTGTEWVEGDNHAAGIKRAGTWSQRPNADGSNLENGFQYFLLESEPDEDPEGNPIESITGNGKPIWWIQDGSKWVDATGATVTG